MSTNFYIDDLRGKGGKDRDALLSLMESGTDYPYWYLNTQLRAAAADEYISSVRDAEEGRNQNQYKAIREEGTNRLVGAVVLIGFNAAGNGDAEIGYFMHQDYQGRGIAMQAVFRVVQDGVTNSGLKTLHATVHPRNVESLKILRNLGLRPDGFSTTSVYQEPDGSPAPRIHLKGKEEDIRAGLERLAERYDSPAPNCSGAREQPVLEWRHTK